MAAFVFMCVEGCRPYGPPSSAQESSFSENVAMWTQRPGVLALRVPAPAPALVNLSELANIELDATVAYTD